MAISLLLLLMLSEYSEGGCSSKRMIMDSNLVPINSVTASSQWDGNHSPSRSKLNTAKVGDEIGSWSAKANDRNQWIQVDLGQAYFITGVITQGRSDHAQWVTSYKVFYSNDNRNWKSYNNGQVLSGNRDQNTMRQNSFSRPFKARFVRFNPQAWNSHVSMRFDVLACSLADYCTYYLKRNQPGKIVSRAATIKDPKAFKDGFTLSLNDQAYMQCYYAIITDLHLPNTIPQANNDIRVLHNSAKVNANTWQRIIFPSTIRVARMVSAYSSSSLTVFSRMAQLTPNLASSNKNTKAAALTEIKKLLQKLKDEANKNIKSSKKIFDQIRAFSSKVVQDYNLAQQVYDRYIKISQSSTVINMARNIKNNHNRLNQLNKDYNHAVVVAATTVTYGWIPIVGWIAGASVAATFAKKAVDLKNQINHLKNIINNDYKKYQYQNWVMNFSKNQLSSLTQIKNVFNGVLSAFDAISNGWGAIRDDITNILSNDLFLVSPRTGVTFELDIAKANWSFVKKMADSYMKQSSK